MVDPYKNAIRSTLKKIRTTLTPTYRLRASHIVCKRIQALEQYRQAKNLALYWSVQGEIDLLRLWESAPLQGKNCFFPSITDQSLSFLPANPRTLFKQNKFGIPEPSVAADQAISIAQIDLMLIPLIAFDKSCTRLGMGFGYYDKALAQVKPKYLIGVAFQFQLLDFICPEPWDVPLDAVITQKAIYWNPSLHPK